MKKYTIIIHKKDIDKEIAVWVDDEISVLLEQVDSKIRKPNWQVYKMPYLKNPKERPKRSREHRATDFVGFKFYRYKTTIRKAIFLCLLRNLRTLQKGNYTAKNCQAFASYNGYIKHTDSEFVRRKYINNKIKIPKIKEVIRNESRKYSTGNKLAAAV